MAIEPKSSHTGVRPIPSATIHQILDRKPVSVVERYAANDRGVPKPAPTWGEIGTSALAVLALVVFLMLLDGGIIR